ncbi:UNVERIFIED_CONTAM: hypothetical protein HDU68_000632 [Siphonaria sp. JEL0065]|nr:hypothetical protein HDU68_000632 [Siphonaria sp. JEL0065]
MDYFQQLDELVRTRIQTLAHLQHLHTGTGFYFDTVRLTSDVLTQNLFKKRRQIESQDLSNVSTTFLETGVYQYLETPDIPFDLDYCHVFMSLCDALIAAYNKLIDGTEDVCGQGYLDAAKRFDALIKKIIVNVFKDLESASVAVMKDELALFVEGKQL